MEFEQGTCPCYMRETAFVTRKDLSAFLHLQREVAAVDPFLGFPNSKAVNLHSSRVSLLSTFFLISVQTCVRVISSID